MNLLELERKFPDEQSCYNYFENIRWGKVPKCAYCGSENLSKRGKDFRYFCNSCRKSSNVKVNTNLHNTKLPLKYWIFAVAIITDAKKGLSALQLQRNLGGHYETVFNLYHKIRALMCEENDKNGKLEGVLEMDETFVGGKPRKKTPTKDKYLSEDEKSQYDAKIAELNEQGFEFRLGTVKKKAKEDSKRGRGTDKIPVAGIVERNGNVIAKVMTKLTYRELKGLVERNVKTQKAVLLTDDYKGYNKMDKIIEHIKLDHKTAYSYRGLDNNTIESFWAIIKRGIMGQYHQVSEKKLPNYVAEFVYKFNNRKDNNLMFDRVIQKLVEPKLN